MRFLFLGLLALLPTGLWANDWDALKQPGAIALMRHALAPGTGDPAGFRLDDCATQRNLNDRGREQARRIGAELRAQGIVFDLIWSSGWCRAYQTAELMQMGPVTIIPALHSFFAGRGDRNAQTQAVLEALVDVAPDTRILIVSHQVNITALTGQTLPSGAMIIAQRDADGQLEVSGRVMIAP